VAENWLHDVWRCNETEEADGAAAAVVHLTSRDARLLNHGY
jgi:hypothetical protein